MDRVKSRRILISIWCEFFAKIGAIMMFKAIISNGLAQVEKTAVKQARLREFFIYLNWQQIWEETEPCGGIFQSKKRNDLRGYEKRVYKLSNRSRMEGVLRKDSPE